MIRVTGLMTGREVVDAHDRSIENLYDVDRQISSGKRFEKPGDAPERMGESLRVNRTLAVAKQVVENAREGVVKLQLMESILDQIGGLVIHAKAMAVRMSNDTMVPENRRVEAQEMMRVLEQIVSLANTKSGEQYLFSGTNVTIEPFIFPDPKNHPGSVAYQGNDSRSYVQQGFTSSVREAGLMRVSEVGSRILGDSVSDPGGTSLLPVMRRFINALNSNDTQAIRSSIDSLENASHQVTEKAAVLGTRERSLRRTLHRLERYQISLKTLKSENEDVDIAKAVSELSLNQNLLAVSTKASRNIIQNTQNALFS